MSELQQALDCSLEIIEQNMETFNERFEGIARQWTDSPRTVLLSVATQDPARFSPQRT